jgi:hypothetical protein
MTEQAVQCAIPVFDGLLPEPYNDHLLRLLFIFAHWHALAKLRQHTELSLDILDLATDQLGKALRDFADKTCPVFDTRELKREAEARLRREAKKNKPSNVVAPPTVSPLAASPSAGLSTALLVALPPSSLTSPPLLQTGTSVNEPLPAVEWSMVNLSSAGGPSVRSATLNQSTDSTAPAEGLTTPCTPAKQETQSAHRAAVDGGKKGKAAAEKNAGRRRKTLNLNTYKNHSLGDYVRTIRTYGTTDSYTTEAVSSFILIETRTYLKLV